MLWGLIPNWRFNWRDLNLNTELLERHYCPIEMVVGPAHARARWAGPRHGTAGVAHHLDRQRHMHLTAHGCDHLRAYLVLLYSCTAHGYAPSSSVVVIISAYGTLSTCVYARVDRGSNF